MFAVDLRVLSRDLPDYLVAPKPLAGRQVPKETDTDYFSFLFENRNLLFVKVTLHNGTYERRHVATQDEGWMARLVPRFSGIGEDGLERPVEAAVARQRIGHGLVEVQGKWTRVADVVASPQRAELFASAGRSKREFEEVGAFPDWIEPGDSFEVIFRLAASARGVLQDGAYTVAVGFQPADGGDRDELYPIKHVVVVGPAVSTIEKVGAHWVRARYYEWLGDDGHEEEELRAGTEVAPALYEAGVELMNFYSRRERWDDAIREAERLATEVAADLIPGLHTRIAYFERRARGENLQLPLVY